MTKPELVEFEAELKSHDWTWEMSDDSSKYHDGQANRNRLVKKARELGEEGIALYNAYDEQRGYPKNPIK